MGPDSFKLSLHEALAMGCDDAYLISSRAFAGSDTLATAYTLSQAVRKIGDVDLILTGLKAIDADTGQVGPLIAEELDLPQITNVSDVINLDSDNHTIDVQRHLGQDQEIIRVSYPLVMGVGDEINEPRYLSPLGIKQSMQKEITVWNETDIQCDPERIGIKGSPTIVTESFVPEESVREMTMLEGSPMEAAEALINILTEQHII